MHSNDAWRTVDLGEGTPRTVISGLVDHVPLEQMQVSRLHPSHPGSTRLQNRLVVLCANLKPAKLKGILSQAMVRRILQPAALTRAGHVR